jgi:hypothetical protein
MAQATNAAVSPQDSQSGANLVHDIVFISKATPEDDEFVLGLAPRFDIPALRYACSARCLYRGRT